MDKNENLAFHNILKQVFHKIVKYEGHLKTRLLIKMDSWGNMKTKSNIKFWNIKSQNENKPKL